MIVKHSLYGYGDGAPAEPPSRAVWFLIGFGACYAALGKFLTRK